MENQDRHQTHAIQRVRVVNPHNLNFYSAYNRGPRVSLSQFSEDKCMQQFIAECDINTILSRYKQTGILPETRNASPQYLDATAYDYQQAMDVVAEAQSLFYNMPSAIRARFDNDPAQLLEFVHNPRNLDESIAMGFIDPTKLPPPTAAPATPPQASTTPSTPPPKAS
ncbi:MAG: internal scaffolding protein [Microvirus sp.]|nr:MAG: internal scaffolding protein [Microvirus sp.]